jgi:hypothetical protein
MVTKSVIKFTLCSSPNKCGRQKNSVLVSFWSRLGCIKFDLGSHLENVNIH